MLSLSSSSENAATLRLLTAAAVVVVVVAAVAVVVVVVVVVVAAAVAAVVVVVESECILSAAVRHRYLRYPLRWGLYLPLHAPARVHRLLPPPRYSKNRLHFQSLKRVLRDFDVRCIP